MPPILFHPTETDGSKKKAQKDIKRAEYNENRDDKDPDPRPSKGGSGGGDDDDDVYSAGDGTYYDYDTCTDTILWAAVHTAAELGHLHALRYLTTRPILGRSTWLLIDDDLIVDAARAGQVAVVAYAHDRMFRGDDRAPCSCTPRVGRAAWEAPTTDVVTWMRDYGCKGCEAPTLQDLGWAISCGYTDMLRFILANATFDLDTDLLEADVATAAYSGHLDALRLAADSGMCARIDLVVIGAARGGNVDVLCWALSPDGNVSARWPMPSASVMRTAAIAAASHGHANAVTWIASRYPDTVDVVLLCAAIKSASLGVVRAVDALLPPATIDWQRMVARVVAAGSADVLEFVIREKRITLDPLAVADVVKMTDAMIQYVSRACAPGDIQKALDVVIVEDGFAWSPRVKHLCERIPGLCTSLGCVGDDPAAGCSCPRCATPSSVSGAAGVAN